MDLFHFLGFEPGDALRSKAARICSRLLEEAPSDCSVSALLELDGDIYRCTVEICSKLYPLVVSVNHRNPSMALDKAELTLLRKLAQRGIRLRGAPERPREPMRAG